VISLEQTLDGFDTLIGAGKIRYWGVAISTSAIWRTFLEARKW
jgi:aryl-alcohol dehydrogenase-like predicted oxidoreductase